MNKMEKIFVSVVNNQDPLHSESFEYQSVFLSKVRPDPTNGRFLPSVFISDEDARLFIEKRLSKRQLVDKYEAEERVIIGKSCIINCMKYGSQEWSKAQKSVDTIIELGDNIAVCEMIQVPTIYPLDSGDFQILTGHRRFFALVYAKGYDSYEQFKVYDRKPLFTKVKQFQENASREDLPQYGKLQAFQNALSEIEALNKARKGAGQRALTIKEVAANLGISMGAYDNYNVLTRYPSVVKAYEEGNSLSFRKAKKIVITIESEFKLAEGRKALNAIDKQTVSETIYARMTGKNQVRKPATDMYKLEPIRSAKALKMLLTSDVTQIDCGVNWQTVDWEDHASISSALVQLSQYLNQDQSQG
ncbi:hypothetical protein AT705_01555 [Pseudoalteromonas rubra]|uniref:Uncharacterized protein n=2 Tax=Pseudoalteromonas rubra TaxID=43658 RepID=A0A0U3IE94_9GAMM|nr:hypothetical protein [Pseudoalteromonas rubra]ALU41724.1 hypothetical protein AT705_01555 [Pseudoalteromonas rubra]